jgi:hypothetical protein
MNIYNINKRTWRLLIGLLTITILVYLFQSKSAFPLGNINKTSDQALSDTSLDVLQPQNDNAIATAEETSDKKAYITFLCDDIMVCNSKKKILFSVFF